MDLTIFSFVPTAVTLCFSMAVLVVAHFFLIRRKNAADLASPLTRQLSMVALALAAVLMVILTLPIGDSTRGQVLSFLGIVVTAAIALSSTTFLGNVMAGLMLKAVKNVRPGDFVRVGDSFGRVSELGLLHTEIQNEDRDLTTLPNIYLVNNPVKVVRSSGTIISATISIGYDAPYSKVVDALIAAAESAELEDAFVHVLELGDYSISYRISGFLEDIKTLISARSRLRVCALHSLHKAGIEIVSPSFMNQRQLDPKQKIVPISMRLESEDEEVPEKLIFDKADEAESIEKLNIRLHDMNAEISTLEAEAKSLETEEQKLPVQNKIEGLARRRDYLRELIAKKKGQSQAV
jgi:small-conductance mechanosensitive channel